MSRENVKIPLFLVVSFVAVSVVLTGYSNTLSADFRALALYAVSTVQLLVAGAIFFFLQQRAEQRIGHYESLWPKITRVSITFLVFSLMIAMVVLLTAGRYSPEQFSWVGAVCFSFYCFMQIAFVEEVIFRGVLFSFLGRESIAALFLSSIFFAIYHIDSGVQALPYYLAMGLVYGVLRRACFSIFTLVIGHGAFVFFQKAIWVESSSLAPTNFYVVAPCVLLCIAILGYYLITFTSRQQKLGDELKLVLSS